MKRIVFPLVLSSLTLFFSAQLTEAHPFPVPRPVPTDSVGIEKKDGKRYILHRVDEGQTLFAIARRYKRSVAEIKAANPDMKDAVRYDQLIRIPVPEGSLSRKQEKAMDKVIRKQEKEERRAEKAEEKDEKAAPTAKTEKPTAKKTADTGKNDPARAGIHVVEPGQTLYSLANRYGVAQEDLRRWNGLSGNNVLIGQALIVSEKAYIARSPSPTPRTPESRTSESKAEPKPTPRAPETKPTAPRTTEPRSTETKPAETRPVESKPTEPKPERKPDTEPTDRGNTHATTTTPAKAPEPEIESPSPGNDAPMPTRGRRVSSSGVAEVIEGTGGSGKYLALHRTAPIGTLVQVRNEFNNQSLWVKVIGRLPDTGVNDKILVKLSSQAFAKLSPIDRRFRAEVSYIAP